MAMDAITPKKDAARKDAPKKPTRKQAEDAVRVLLAWAGDDPSREGLLDTPKRVVKAYEEWFAGYDEDPVKYLSRTFDDVQGYDDIVMLKNIDVESHCEHHMAPSKRLQTQETMTAQICDAITDSLAPMGTAVLIEAEHQCMSTRGVHHKDVTTVTTQFTGVFKSNDDLRNRFLRLSGQM